MKRLPVGVVFLGSVVGMWLGIASLRWLGGRDPRCEIRVESHGGYTWSRACDAVPSIRGRVRAGMLTRCSTTSDVVYGARVRPSTDVWYPRANGFCYAEDAQGPR